MSALVFGGINLGAHAGAPLHQTPGKRVAPISEYALAAARCPLSRVPGYSVIRLVLMSSCKPAQALKFSQCAKFPMLSSRSMA